MARDPSIHVFRKSPLNVAAGKLLKELREKRGWKPEQAAQAFGVATTYLGQIEIGTRALPATCTVGLTELGVPLPSASLLLTLIVYVDQRDKGTGLYTAQEIIRRAEHLRANTLMPWFDDALEWLIVAVRKLQERKNFDIEDGARLLAAALDSLPGLAAATTSQKQAPPPQRNYKLSPVFEDLVDQMVRQLALIHPQINLPSFQTWEASNAHRFLEVRAFVDSAQRLLSDAQNFDWNGILNNRFRPKIHVFLSATDPMEAEEAQREFRSKLKVSAKGSQTIKENVIFRNFDSASENEVRRRLIYDLAEERPISAKIWSEFGRAILDEKRFVQYNNIWLYSMHGEEARAKDHPPLLVGVLGAYNDKDQTAFGSMVNGETLDEWWKLMSQALEH